jgi:predicted aspartyl protease
MAKNGLLVVTSVFDPHADLIYFFAQIVGPARRDILRLALDTGATFTVVSLPVLIELGFTPSLVTGERILTGSGVEFLPRVIVQGFTALGQERSNFPVLGHELPSGSGVDGVLGLDFLRGLSLTVDFRAGQITLS